MDGRFGGEVAGKVKAPSRNLGAKRLRHLLCKAAKLNSLANERIQVWQIARFAMGGERMGKGADAVFFKIVPSSPLTIEVRYFEVGE